MFQAHTTEESCDFMEIWKQSQKRDLGIYKKKIKNSEMPHNTNLDGRQPLSKTWSQENSTEEAQVMHWHKNNIKSEIWH